MISSVLDPASPGAAAIASLFWLLHSIAGFICLAVLTAALWFVYRFRARTPAAQGALIYGDTRLELAWTAAPALLLTFIFALTLAVMLRSEPDPSAAAAGGDPPVRVTVVGHQYWWEFRLPDHGVITANELHLPVGRPAVFDLLASDVIHSFWLPRLFGKRDLIPGRTNQLAFTPTEVGAFQGVCAEFCGAQHAWMHFVTFVDTPNDFVQWVRQQNASPSPAADGLPARGRELFLSTTCQSCHAIRGASEPLASAGPDLTHIGSRTTLAAGVLPNTPDNLARWLRSPQEVKPGNLMPNMRLTEEDIAALTAYLASLK
ncbi:MAG: cytochrome c oxidase subunit II [Chloroflexi bacterium]|nr:cytochrome c oxidase subunit II [Chloroflexota bacterium]